MRYFTGYDPVSEEQIAAEIAALDVGRTLDMDIGDGVTLRTTIRAGETQDAAASRAVLAMFRLVDSAVRRTK